MKRLITSESGKESYGSKWQNIDSESDDHHHIHSSTLKTTKTAQSSNQGDNDQTRIEQENDDDDGLHSAPVGSNEIAQVPSIGAAEVESPTIQQGSNSRRISPDGETMYRAAIQGDWLAAEVLLSRNPSLATDYLTAEGDRALHVAAAMKRDNFVRKLVNWMKDEDELLLRDGHGCTACCYAALSGVVQIARVMVEKKPTLVTTYDDNKLTPLHKAALRGNKGMLSYLLKSSRVEDLPNDAWFDILLATMQEKMFDSAIELVEKTHIVLATKDEDKRTALHLLARLDVSNVVGPRLKLLEFISGAYLTERGKRPSSFLKLGEKLWSEMQKMERSSLLELIRKQHIVHDAAKAGHVELVTMLLRSYPQLVMDTDSDGYTIFHIAVTYRQHAVFSLIHQVKAMMHTRIISRDKDGNNILHLAAKLSAGYLNRTETTPHMLLREELKWFNRMLNDSRTWMMNSADSCMLIATIILSVVFAAGFALPGGYDPQTGKPLLFVRLQFKYFLCFELQALIGSVLSILFFRSIMTSSFAEEDFLIQLPLTMLLGFNVMVLSLIGAVGAFMSSFLLVGLKSDIDQGVRLFSAIILSAACVLWFFREVAKTCRWELVYTLRKRKSPFSVYNHSTATIT